MCCPGNPFVIGVKVLCEESGSNRGEVANGTMAVRFATQELAEHFLNIVNGLEVYSAQCQTLEQLTRDEMRTDRPRHRVIRCRAILKVSASRARRQLDRITVRSR